jgi:C2 domain
MANIAVQFHRGQNLPQLARDTSPFIKAEFKGERYQTKWMHKTREPVWNECWLLHGVCEGDSLSVALWQKEFHTGINDSELAKIVYKFRSSDIDAPDRASSVDLPLPCGGRLLLRFTALADELASMINEKRSANVRKENGKCDHDVDNVGSQDSASDGHEDFDNVDVRSLIDRDERRRGKRRRGVVSVLKLAVGACNGIFPRIERMLLNPGVPVHFGLGLVGLLAVLAMAQMFGVFLTWGTLVLGIWCLSQTNEHRQRGKFFGRYLAAINRLRIEHEREANDFAERRRIQRAWRRERESSSSTSATTSSSADAMLSPSPSVSDIGAELASSASVAGGAAEWLSPVWLNETVQSIWHNIGERIFAEKVVPAINRAAAGAFQNQAEPGEEVLRRVVVAGFKLGPEPPRINSIRAAASSSAADNSGDIGRSAASAYYRREAKAPGEAEPVVLEGQVTWVASDVTYVDLDVWWPLGGSTRRVRVRLSHFIWQIDMRLRLWWTTLPLTSNVVGISFLNADAIATPRITILAGESARIAIPVDRIVVPLRKLVKKVIDNKLHQMLLHPNEFKSTLGGVVLRESDLAQQKDPITNVAIFFAARESALPEGWFPVSSTICGSAAGGLKKLPSSSSSASKLIGQVWLCYTRKKDRPPITDIGVVYRDPKLGVDGHVPPEFELVRWSVSGANFPGDINYEHAERGDTAKQVMLAVRRGVSEPPITSVGVWNAQESRGGKMPPDGWHIVTAPLSAESLAGTIGGGGGGSGASGSSSGGASLNGDVPGQPHIQLAYRGGNRPRVYRRSPITDIVVANPDDDVLPPGYTLVRRTVSGTHSASCNSRSRTRRRRTRIFLAFSRSPARGAPITALALQISGRAEPPPAGDHWTLVPYVGGGVANLNEGLGEESALVLWIRRQPGAPPLNEIGVWNRTKEDPSTYRTRGLQSLALTVGEVKANLNYGHRGAYELYVVYSIDRSATSQHSGGALSPSSSPATSLWRLGTGRAKLLSRLVQNAVTSDASTSAAQLPAAMSAATLSSLTLSDFPAQSALDHRRKRMAAAQTGLQSQSFSTSEASYGGAISLTTGERERSATTTIRVTNRAESGTDDDGGSSMATGGGDTDNDDDEEFTDDTGELSDPRLSMDDDMLSVSPSRALTRHSSSPPAPSRLQAGSSRLLGALGLVPQSSASASSGSMLRARSGASSAPPIRDLIVWHGDYESDWLKLADHPLRSTGWSVVNRSVSTMHSGSLAAAPTMLTALQGVSGMLSSSPRDSMGATDTYFCVLRCEETAQVKPPITAIGALFGAHKSNAAEMLPQGFEMVRSAMHTGIADTAANLNESDRRLPSLHLCVSREPQHGAPITDIRLYMHSKEQDRLPAGYEIVWSSLVQHRRASIGNKKRFVAFTRADD